MREHPDEVEADLQRYYAVDLRDLWRGGLTLRRVGVLLRGLPDDSLFATAMRRETPASTASAGDLDAARWGMTHELLAAVIDATNQVGWAVFQAASSKRLPPPAPFLRPGKGAKRKRGMSEATRARIAGWIEASRIQSVATPVGGVSDGD